MQSLVIINHEPLTEYNKQLWMLDDLKKRGVDVSYWDISGICNKKVKSYFTIDHAELRVVRNYYDFIDLINNSDRGHTLFADVFPYTWGNLWLRFLLRLKSCKLIRIQQHYYNTRPSQIPKQTNQKDFLNKLSTWLLVRTTKLFKLQEYKKVFSPFDLGLGDYSKLNLPDYELFKRKEGLIKNDGNIVFIDQFIPLHPDLLILNDYHYSERDIKEYRTSMIALFDSLEKRYKKEVVILAHPKAKYDGAEFGNRRIIHGNTCETLLMSSIVVFHYSNAISFAVLSNKPIICCYTNWFKRIIPKSYKHLLNNARLLEVIAHDLDVENIDDIIPDLIPENKRKDYIYSSLTTKETENSLNCDIISNYFLNE